jgi:ankyrin repeat protein
MGFPIRAISVWMSPLPSVAGLDYFFASGGTIASLMLFAIRNLMTFLAAILMASPVAGFLPIRTFRSTLPVLSQTALLRPAAKASEFSSHSGNRRPEIPAGRVAFPGPFVLVTVFCVALASFSCGASARHQQELNQRLLNACFEGTGPVVEQLLKAGADPNSTGIVKPFHPGTEPLSALEIACSNSSVNPEATNIAQALLKKRAKPSVKALVFALDGNQAHLVTLLVKAGVDVKKKAQIEGREVFPIIACVTSPMSSSTSSIENLNTLRASGASVNVADSSGRTPLLIAAADFATLGGLIDPLLARGADVKAKGRDGKTAVDLLRAEDSECHSAADYRAGTCDAMEAALARLTAATTAQR